MVSVFSRSSKSAPRFRFLRHQSLHAKGIPGANLMPGMVARSFVNAAFAAACFASLVVLPMPWKDAVAVGLLGLACGAHDHDDPRWHRVASTPSTLSHGPLTISYQWPDSVTSMTSYLSYMAVASLVSTKHGYFDLRPRFRTPRCSPLDASVRASP